MKATRQRAAGLKTATYRKGARYFSRRVADRTRFEPINPASSALRMARSVSRFNISGPFTSRPLSVQAGALVGGTASLKAWGDASALAVATNQKADKGEWANRWQDERRRGEAQIL